MIRILLINKVTEFYHSLSSSVMIKNLTKVFINDILVGIVKLLTIIIIIRSLTVSDYAAYIVFATVAFLMPALIGGGLNNALIRYSSEYISLSNKKPFELYIFSFIFQIILYVLTCILFVLLGVNVIIFLFGEGIFKLSFYYGLIAGFGSLLLNSGKAIFQAEENFNAYIKIIWFREIVVLFFILLLYIINKRLDFENIAIIVIVVNIIAGIFVLSHILTGYKISNIFNFLETDLILIKNFIIATNWLTLYFVVLTGMQRLDIFMLLHFSSKNEIANYGVALQYYTIGLLLLGSIHVVLLPKFSKIDMQERYKQKEFVKKWLKITAWLIVPISLGAILIKPLFNIVSGFQYEKAYYMFLIFAIGIWISLMFSPLINILISRKSFRFLFFLSIIALFINFFGNYFMIPIWGGIGAVIAIVFSNAVINIFAYKKILKEIVL